MASKNHNGRFASPFGNPLWLILPKGKYGSPKLLGLQTSFEQSFAANLRNLKPHDVSTFHSFLWIRQAVDALLVSRKLVKTLMDDLEFPSSLWNEKWLQSYMDDTVNILDLCVAFIAEVSRLEQQQVFLRYAQGILDSSFSPSTEQLKRAARALSEWMQKLRLSSEKLEDVPPILEGWTRTFALPKIKNSAKGKVLMRAFYAFNLEMVFISNVILTLLSGCCSGPLFDLQVGSDFKWAEDFNDLQATINRELRSSMSSGKPLTLKELDEVDSSSRYLHDVILALVNSKDAANEEEVRRKCGEPILDLAQNAKCVAHNLELLEKRLDDLLDLVLSERGAVLDGFRISCRRRCSD